jgi:hypothetical protein
VATYTIYANSDNTKNGRLTSANSSYSTARSGGTVTSSSSLRVGQETIATVDNIFESFLEFDTSVLSGKTITSATFEAYVSILTTDAAHTAQVRLRDFGSTFTTGDWVAGASLSALTLLATLTSASAVVSSWNAFTDVALAANINTAGNTRVIVVSSRTVSGTAPSGSNDDEYFVLDFINGSNRPRLVVETDENSAAADITLGAATSSAAGTLEIAGAATPSLDDLALSSTATLSGTQEGLLNKSLDDLTVSSTVAIETFGYTEITLGDVTLSTVALVDLDGELTATLGALTAESVIAWNFEGALTATLDALTLGSVNISGVDASVTATLGALTLQAVESGPPWPVQYDFPQSPLDGTWRRERGDDTLRSDRAVGARQYRTQNGGNYADATFAIMVKSKTALDLLDRFFRDDCKNGAKPFYWIDPETGANMAWLWAAPPQIRHVSRETYRVDCALLKEAA